MRKYREKNAMLRNKILNHEQFLVKLHNLKNKDPLLLKVKDPSMRMSPVVGLVQGVL